MPQAVYYPQKPSRERVRFARDREPLPASSQQARSFARNPPLRSRVHASVVAYAAAEVLEVFRPSVLGIVMQIVSKRDLQDFWERHRDAETPLLAWYRKVLQEDWDNPAKVKATYGSASIIAGNRVVFNIKGNRYRLVAIIDYSDRIVYIRFIGTHSAYDAIDVKET